MHHVVTQILRGATSATNVKRPNLMEQEAVVEEDMEVDVAVIGVVAVVAEDLEEVEEIEVVVDLEEEEGLDEAEIEEVADQ